ncbi:hypothetical protein FB45DRAFT_900864 [Roridomyces roridus]|uniref:Uncharacterized protein n=1 Tax=Roridomyces roridus TaxID=1738132 RepID=A0AAD7C8Q8_9AGAR|nr:hypothetical protein FB45DRAFT_900864 [Roridomyces roridus]
MANFGESAHIATGPRIKGPQARSSSLRCAMTCVIPPSGTFFQLVDFQFLCLTVNSGNVITSTCEFGGAGIPAEQQWTLIGVNHGTVLLSGLSVPPSSLFFLTQGSNGQAIASSNTGFGFNVSCVSAAERTVSLVDNLVGTEITLTSSTQSGSDDAQVLGGRLRRMRCADSCFS